MVNPDNAKIEVMSAERRSQKRSWLQRLRKWWVARSLVVGALAVVVDLTIGNLLLWIGKLNGFDRTTQWSVSLLGLRPTLNLTSTAAMVGGIFGPITTYFLNRSFAFADSKAPVHKSAAKFVAAIGVGTIVHGQLVYWLRDVVGFDFVPSKLIADVMIFTVPQLLVLRFFIFPKAKVEPPAPPQPGH